MSEEEKKAFDFAADLAKQLITLATAIVGAVVTFFEKGKPSDQTLIAVSDLKWPLVIYIISILFGIGSLMALTGTLEKNGSKGKIYTFNIQLQSGLQIVTFLGATLWIVMIVGAK